MPWTNLNQIQISFNEAVNVQQASLALTGVNVANYAFSGFSYNATTHTATWTLANPIGADRLQLDLKSSGAAAVTSTSGSSLDGEWTNGASVYPSGNGAAGGDFNFAFNVLPSDLNQDGIVNGQDIVAIASHWLQVGGITGDTNGDDIVNGQDISAIASRWLSTLPGGGGGGSADAIATGSSVPAIGIGPSAASTPAATITPSQSPLAAALSAIEQEPLTPAFVAPATPEHTAAFIGRQDSGKIASAIDKLMSDSSGNIDLSHVLPLSRSWAQAVQKASLRQTAVDHLGSTIDNLATTLDEDLVEAVAAAKR
jgi:hypothetical protein